MAHGIPFQGSAKPKYSYKTVDELKQKNEYRSSSKGGAGPGGGVKVIDMTGPQKRVLTGYDEIHNRHTHPEEASQEGVCACVCSCCFLPSVPPSLPPSLPHYLPLPCEGAPKKNMFLPELLHNIQLLVDQTEADIIRTDRRLRYNRDLVVNLAHEKEQREEQTQDLNEEVEKLSEIVSTIDM